MAKLATKTITVRTPEEQEIQITVRQADLRAGFRRGRLQGELIYGENVERSDPDLANAYAVYCDLVAGTAQVAGALPWPMDVAEFVAQSDLWFDCVGLPWLQSVRELNPHWAPGYRDTQGETPSAVASPPDSV